MKPPTVFLGEMTNPEVEAFLRDHDTVIVPVGSTEQHGPHGPLLTDVLVPVEVARRVAPRRRRRRRAIDQLRAVVSARRVHRRRPPADRDIHGVRRGRAPSAWRRWASGGSCSSTATTTTRSRSPTPARTRRDAAARRRARLPDQLLGRHDRRARPAEFFGPTNGLHANKAETSAVMAIDPGARRHGRGQRRDAAVPRGDQPGRRSTPRSSSRRPGSVHRATHSGTWGDARESTAEYGERYLRGRHRGDAADARRRRAHVRGDAAALRSRLRQSASPPNQVPARMTRRTRERRVELDEIGPLADRDAGRDR